MYYLQIISSLKLSYSPIKQNNILKISISPTKNVPFNDSLNVSGDHDLVRQSIKLKENEEKLSRILLQESVQLDIQDKAKEMAEQIW